MANEEEEVFSMNVGVEEEGAEPSEPVEPVAPTEPEAEPEPAAEESKAEAIEEQTEPPAEEGAEAPAEPQAAAKPAPVPAAPAPDPEVERLRQSDAEFQRAMSIPEVRKAYLKDLHAKGQLDPRYLPEIQDAPAPAAPAAPATPKFSFEDASKKFQAAMAAGNEAEAFRTMDEYFSAKSGAQIGDIQAKLGAEENRRAQEAQAAEMRSIQNHVRSEIGGLAKQWPTLLTQGADGRPIWKDAAVGKAFLENCQGVAPTKPLGKIMKLTLMELGRLGEKPKAAASTKPAAKPAPTPAAPKAPVQEPGVFSMQIPVHD